MIEPAKELQGPSRHVRITCPHCQRSNLKINRANLGCDVYCKQCGKRFRAVLADDPRAIAPSTQQAPRESHASASAESDQIRGAHAKDHLQQICAERDRLRVLLGESEADRLRLAEQAEELEALSSDRDRLDVAVRAGMARTEQLEARIHEVEQRAGEERDQAEDQRRVWQERLDAAGLQLEQDRERLAATVRRNEELAEQARELGTELDRLRRDREDEARAQQMSLEALRHELENNRAEAAAASDRAAGAVTTRAELEGRLAEFEDRLRAANERSQQLEDEMQAQRDRVAALPSEDDPGQSLADGDREADRLRDQVETLVLERDVALRQIEDLRSHRDRMVALLEQAEAAGREAARQEALAHQPAQTIEQDREQLAALVRRNEELAEQAQGLGTELDRLRSDREAERREQRTSLEALRHELENARAEAAAASDRAAAAAATRDELDMLRREREDERREQGLSLEALRRELEMARAAATAARDRAAAATATRAELEGRLAEFEDRLRAANERSQQLEDEMQAQRERVAALPSENGPAQSLGDGDRDADRLRIEQLTADLDQARAANERLRSLLNVFGLVDHMGPGARGAVSRDPIHPDQREDE
jgi:chromosome segregation ATPase